MKKKINSQFAGIAIVSVMAALLLAILVFYGIFKEQIFTDLETDIYLIEHSLLPDELDRMDEAYVSEGVRVTYIDEDGTVLYDNQTKAEKLTNHLDRPEIKEAVEEGIGKSVRQSETMQLSNFYYAKQMPDGRILRVSRETHSLWHLLFRALPMLAVLTVILVGVCIVLSRLLTKSLLLPIEQMADNMEDVKQGECYEEIRPFIDTIQKQHESILKNAKMRQDFTANVSHELKTPLTAISGYAELIENGMAESQNIQHFGKEIHKSAGRLLTLINDIIRLSELDATVQEVPFEAVNLYQIAMDTVNMLQINAQNHHVSLEFEGSLCYIFGDKQMIDELLYNLCDNAIRYNNMDGHVWVKVHKRDNEIILSVKDTGIGISKEHQERIFERFYRVDKSRSKSTGGTGLGLAIVKHIVAKQNARMELFSEAGKGTEIKVYFAPYTGEEKKEIIQTDEFDM